MESDAEVSTSHTQDACGWKCYQRKLSPDDRLFEAGDTACRVRYHKYVCDLQSYSSNPDISASAKSSVIVCQQLRCQKKFCNLLEYEMHYNTLHRYICSSCCRCFPTQHLLDLHLVEWHDAMFELQSDSQKMYCCLVETCRECFWTHSRRTDHMVKTHKYPSSFRFVKCRLKANASAAGDDDSSLMECVESVSLMSLPDDSTSVDAVHSDSKTSLRKFSPRVPKNICFGHGASRGFQRR